MSDFDKNFSDVSNNIDDAHKNMKKMMFVGLFMYLIGGAVSLSAVGVIIYLLLKNFG